MVLQAFLWKFFISLRRLVGWNNPKLAREPYFRSKKEKIYQKGEVKK